MKKLFGTDGVRGIANEELTGELAFKLGRAGGYFLSKNNSVKTEKPIILIGKDTRISGDMLESALIAGVTSAGIDVIQLGIIPTPGVAYLTEVMEVSGSIMISASHNPIADNGIKFFQGNGCKLTDEMEEKIEDLIYESYEEIPAPTHRKIGKSRKDKTLVDLYVDHLINSVNHNFDKVKVVLDCANGAAYKVAPRVLKKLKAEVSVINNSSDGSKINVNSGSTNPELAQKKVLEKGADIGIAHDGDADRVILIDEKGNIIDGDKIMAILALNMIEKEDLNGNTLVTTRYSNMGLEETLEENDGRLITARNGDRYVLKKMLNQDYNLGGEKSGHIILLDYNNTGDGILTAIQIIEVMLETGRPLSDLARVMEEWPQKLFSIKVKNKKEWKQNKNIKKIVEKAERDLGNNGRIFIRASGTEPVIRVMLEGKDENKLKHWQEKISEVIKSELG
ncbi:MAG: phosphoglucosamine mutase [Halanaerobiales bacterium]